MRAVEKLVRRKLEKRAPDERSPNPDPYELRALQGCSLLFPTETQTEGNQSGQTLLSQNPTGVKLQRRLIVKHGFWNTTETTKWFYQTQQQQTTRPHYRLTQHGKTINPCDLLKALLNLFVESTANDQATYTECEWNNMSDVNRTATSEQSWRRKEPTPRRKQSTQDKH